MLYIKYIIFSPRLLGTESQLVTNILYFFVPQQKKPCQKWQGFLCAPGMGDDFRVKVPNVP